MRCSSHPITAAAATAGNTSLYHTKLAKNQPLFLSDDSIRVEVFLLIIIMFIESTLIGKTLRGMEVAFW